MSSIDGSNERAVVDAALAALEFLGGDGGENEGRNHRNHKICDFDRGLGCRFISSGVTLDVIKGHAPARVVVLIL